MIVTGIIREIFWGLPVYDAEHIVGAVPVHQGDGLIMGATLLAVLRAFANGGSSLTGVEAISNTVSVFRKPQGSNARQVLTVMACILGFLVAGVSYLAHVTHAPPYLLDTRRCCTCETNGTREGRRLTLRLRRGCRGPPNHNRSRDGPNVRNTASRSGRPLPSSGRVTCSTR